MLFGACVCFACFSANGVSIYAQVVEWNVYVGLWSSYDHIRFVYLSNPISVLSFHLKMLREDVFIRNLTALDICFNLPCIFSFKSCSQSSNTTFIILLFSSSFHISCFSKAGCVCQSGRAGGVFCQWNCTTSCHGAKESKLKLAMATPYFPDEIFNNFSVWKWRGDTNMNMHNDIFFLRTFFGREKWYTAGRRKSLKSTRFVRFWNGSISEPVPQ